MSSLCIIMHTYCRCMVDGQLHTRAVSPPGERLADPCTQLLNSFMLCKASVTVWLGTDTEFQPTVLVRYCDLRSRFS
jgi:hypothetical protein